MRADVRLKNYPAFVRAVPVAVLLLAICVAGLLSNSILPFGAPAIVWVAGASSCFLLIGLISVALCRDLFALLVLVGLAFCFTGDIVGLYDFTYGALSFLVAHLFFIVAFLSRGVSRKRLWSCLTLVSIATLGVSLWLLPHVRPEDLPLVLGYTGVIAAMVFSAGVCCVPRWQFPLAGAVVFFVSDIAVARWRFVSPGSENAFFCYPLYYAACAVLALSPMVTREQSGSIRGRAEEASPC